MPTFLLRRIGKVSKERMKSDVFAGIVKETLSIEANKVKTMYSKTVASWASKPEFFIRYGWGGDYNADIYTPDLVYMFLDFGTSHRYAIMSDPYVPRTIPHFIGSIPGMGKAVKRGRGVPDQGEIKARGWSEDITTIMRPDYRREMSNAVKRAVRAMRGT